ncbi:unnamed protein product [Hymenolepis diminuta]|uniref:Myosin_tail_1 domain-containing protein n=1 Tax=Hymenolepis diminuta TaxID=6216 RepID=A0A0R3SZL9_HYMDI|nr:unnamed protein product [Hymenolepis diminuta]VUZ56601.1 unnamed protein product [Hymenolepis diminuta]
MGSGLEWSQGEQRLAKNTLLEEKKRLESSMMHRDVELEKVQTALKESENRCKRRQSRLDQARGELSVERANVQRIEAQRATLEEQNKELREQLENEKAEKETANPALIRVDKLGNKVCVREREVRGENGEVRVREREVVEVKGDQRGVFYKFFPKLFRAD